MPATSVSGERLMDSFSDRSPRLALEVDGHHVVAGPQRLPQMEVSVDADGAASSLRVRSGSNSSSRRSPSRSMTPATLGMLVVRVVELGRRGAAALALRARSDAPQARAGSSAGTAAGERLRLEARRRRHGQRCSAAVRRAAHVASMPPSVSRPSPACGGRWRRGSDGEALDDRGPAVLAPLPEVALRWRRRRGRAPPCERRTRRPGQVGRGTTPGYVGRAAPRPRRWRT